MNLMIRMHQNDQIPQNCRRPRWYEPSSDCLIRGHDSYPTGPSQSHLPQRYFIKINLLRHIYSKTFDFEITTFILAAMMQAF